MANYQLPRFSANLHFTWAHTFKSSITPIEEIFDKYCYLGKLQDELIIVEEGDPRLEELLDQIIELNEQPYTRKDMSSRAIFNVGADYKIGRLTLGLNIHNLLNTRYDRSGMNTNLVPQQGRWWQISIGYKI